MAEHDGRARASDPEPHRREPDEADREAEPAPGKHTLTDGENFRGRLDARHVGQFTRVPPPRPAPAGPTISRDATGPVTARDPDAEFARAASGGAGQVPFRAVMERHFDADFSSVRAFTGRAVELSGLGARAATRGDTIVFGPAAPDAHLVAHELAHVVQFRKSGGAGGSRAVSQPGDAAEAEAERAASLLHVPDARLVIAAAPGARILRDPGDRVPPPILSRAILEATTYITAIFGNQVNEFSLSWLTSTGTRIVDLTAAALGVPRDELLTLYGGGLGAFVNAQRPILTGYVRDAAETVITAIHGAIAQVEKTEIPDPNQTVTQSVFGWFSGTQQMIPNPDYLDWVARTKTRTTLIDGLNDQMLGTIAQIGFSMVPALVLTAWGASGEGVKQRVMARLAGDIAGLVVQNATWLGISTFAPAALPWANIIAKGTGIAARYLTAWALTPRREGTEPAKGDSVALAGNLLRVKLTDVSGRYRFSGGGSFRVTGAPELGKANGDWFTPSGTIDFWMNDAVTPVALADASQLVLDVGGFKVKDLKGAFDIDLGFTGDANVEVVGSEPPAAGALGELKLSRGGWFSGALAIDAPALARPGAALALGKGKMGPHFARGVEVGASLAILPSEDPNLFEEGANQVVELGAVQPYDPAQALSFARRDVELPNAITLKHDTSRIVAKKFSVESSGKRLVARGHGELTGNPKQGAAKSAAYTITWTGTEKGVVDSKIDRKPPKPEVEPEVKKDEQEGEKVETDQSGGNLMVSLDQGLRKTTYVGWGYQSLKYFAKTATRIGIFALNVKQTAKPTLDEPPKPDEDGKVETQKPEDKSGFLTRWLDYGSWTEAQLKKLQPIHFSDAFPTVKLSDASHVAVRNAGGKPLVELLLGLEVKVTEKRGGSGFIKALWLPFDAPHIVLHGGLSVGENENGLRLEGIEADPQDGLSVARAALHFDLPEAFGKETPSFKTEVQWLRLGRRGVDFRTASAKLENIDIHKVHINSAGVDVRPGASGKRFHVGADATLRKVFDHDVNLHADVEWERAGNVTGSVGGSVARIDALGGKLALDKPSVTATLGDQTFGLELDVEHLELFKGDENGLALHDAQARFTFPRPGKDDAPGWRAELHIGSGELRVLDKVRVAATDLKLDAGTESGLKLDAKTLDVKVEGTKWSVKAAGLSIDAGARKFKIELVEFTLPDPDTNLVHFDRPKSAKENTTTIRLENLDLGALAERAMKLRASERKAEREAPKDNVEPPKQVDKKEEEPKEPALKFKLSLENAPELRVGDDVEHPYLRLRLDQATVGANRQGGGEDVQDKKETTAFEIAASGEINIGSLHAKIGGAKARVDLTDLGKFSIEVGSIEGTVGNSASFSVASLKFDDGKLTLGSGKLDFKALLGGVLPPDVAKLQDVVLSIGGVTLDTKARSISVNEIAAGAGTITLFERVKLEEIALAVANLTSAAPAKSTDPLINEWNGKLKIRRASVDIAGDFKPSAGAELEFGPGGVKGGRITDLQLGDEYGTGVTAGLIDFRKDGFVMKDVGIKVNSETFTKSAFLSGARAHLESILPDWILPGDVTIALVFDGSYTSGAGFKLGNLRPSLRAAKLKLFGQEGSFDRDKEKFGVKLGKKGTFSPVLQFPLYPGVGVEVRGIIAYDLSAEANGGITKGGDSAAVNADAALKGHVKAQIAAGAFGGVPHVFSVAGGIAAGLDVQAAATVKMEGLLQLPSEKSKAGGNLGFDFRIGGDGTGPASVKVVAGPYVSLTFLGMSHTFQFDLIKAELFSFEAFGGLSLAFGGMMRDGAAEDRFKKTPDPFPGYNLYVGKELAQGYQGAKKAILDAKMSLALKRLRKDFVNIEAAEARIAEEEEWYQTEVAPKKLQVDEKKKTNEEEIVDDRVSPDQVNWDLDQKFDTQRTQKVQQRKHSIKRLQTEIQELEKEKESDQETKVKECEKTIKKYDKDLGFLNEKLDQYQYQLLFADAGDQAKQLLEEADDVDGLIAEQEEEKKKDLQQDHKEKVEDKKKRPSRLKRAVRGGRILIHLSQSIGKGTNVWHALKQTNLSMRAEATGRKPATEGDPTERLRLEHYGTLENKVDKNVLTKEELTTKIDHKKAEIDKAKELLGSAQNDLDLAQNVKLDQELQSREHQQAKLTRMNELKDHRLQGYDPKDRPIKPNQDEEQQPDTLHKIFQKVENVAKTVHQQVAPKVKSLGEKMHESVVDLVEHWYRAEMLMVEISKTRIKAEQRAERLKLDLEGANDKLEEAKRKLVEPPTGQQPRQSKLDEESGHQPPTTGMSPDQARQNFEIGFWQRRITLINKQLQELQVAQQQSKEETSHDLSEEVAKELQTLRQKWFKKIKVQAPLKLDEVRKRAEKFVGELIVEHAEAQAKLAVEEAMSLEAESAAQSLEAEAKRLEQLFQAQQQPKQQKPEEEPDQTRITGARFVEDKEQVSEQPLSIKLDDQKLPDGLVTGESIKQAQQAAEKARREQERLHRRVLRLRLDEQVAARYVEEASRHLDFTEVKKSQ